MKDKMTRDGQAVMIHLADGGTVLVQAVRPGGVDDVDGSQDCVELVLGVPAVDDGSRYGGGARMRMRLRPEVAMWLAEAIADALLDLDIAPPESHGERRRK